MKKNILATAFVIAGLISIAQAQPTIQNRSELVIGEILEFESRVLNEARTLNVYLPNGYSAGSDKKYPVIYLLDGSIDEDFIHISGLVQFGSFSWVNILPESIVVGIANVDRQRDFTVPSGNLLDQQDFPTSGGADAFIEFVSKEVQPLIESTYHTNGTRTLIGQSLGGLMAAQIMLLHPELFDNYVIVSPSLWWDDEKLLSVAPELAASPKSIFICVGNEDEIMQRTAKNLFEKVLGLDHNAYTAYFEYFKEHKHMDILHQAVYAAFSQIFQGMP